MRTLLPAALLAGLALPLAGAAFAADLDYPNEPPAPTLYERPLPPPVVYPRPVIYPRPVVRLYPRPYPLYYPRPFVRVYPRPVARLYARPVVRYEPRPDVLPSPYPREEYGRPYSREAEEYRYRRDDYGRSREDGARPFPREGYERHERPDFSRAAPFERDDHYADRRDLPPRGDYDR